MLDRNRLDRVLTNLNQTGLDQMIISDPLAIKWLTGRRFYAGERFLGLYIAKDREPVLLLNALFQFDEDLGVRKLLHKDTDDIIPFIQSVVDPRKKLGVDKILTAKFLLPMIDRGVAVRIENGSPGVDRTRAVKDEEEKELMRISSKINDMAMEQFKGLVHEGVTEREVAAQTLDIYKSLGAEAFSFPSIVAFGANAADPHHMPDDTVVKEGDTVLFDVGCMYHGYCSDMTRVFFFKKEPSSVQKKIYNIVRKANEDAEAMVKAGITLHSIDKTARDVIRAEGYGEYFTHRLGHFIGLEDHEAGDVAENNMTLTEAGNIFSIEPGIYKADEAGVRIEDLVIVTEDGCEVLNRFPKDIQIIG
ncbi:MAG: Xaa-Pro peptidase family protein [Solobacterium sp.]|nr:Xaa-Pro peptidase family protein [Solobacterium sp.]